MRVVLFKTWEKYLLAGLLLGLAAAAPGRVAAASEGRDGGLVSGTYRGRVLTELFRHRQQQARRQALRALSASEPLAARSDEGNVAIIDESAGVVIQSNFFDLGGSSVVFTPSGDTYTAAPQALEFDEAARVNGIPITLADDDAQRVLLPFQFPYFGETYDQGYVHSDGNLTFGEPDARSTTRHLARAVTGPPRLCVLFSDLDPRRSGASVGLYMTADRAVITWNGVPPYSSRGVPLPQTFQLELHRDGKIAMRYKTITVNDAVVGLMPGRLRGDATPLDLSVGGTPESFGALAEIFSSTSGLDTPAAAQRFYENHDDAYDYIVLFNNTNLSVGFGVFANETNVRNEVLGIGDLLSADPIFDFGPDFGSPRRLVSFLNMGPLRAYPDDPQQAIPGLGENNTLSVLGQESGHRFLAFVRFIDPATGLPSSALLGRDLAHWSFFFNSEASVVEGNRLTDHGAGISPRFETVGAVTRYSELDQYIMGLRAPEEVPGTFLVTNPSVTFSPARAPQVGVSFDGTRKNISVDLIIAAEGERVPHASVAQKDFRFAFVLLVEEGSAPAPEDVAKLDRIRQEWEQFFDQAVDQRGRAHTDLAKLLHLSTWPAAGLLAGVTGQGAVQIAEPRATGLDVLLSVDNGAITAPSVVTIPAGAVSASFSITGNSAGLAVLEARVSEAGYDSPTTVVQVRPSPSALVLTLESGADQLGASGNTLSNPVVFRVVDANRLPYSAVPLVFAVSGDGEATPARAVTDAEGRVAVDWRLATSGERNSLTATLEGVPGANLRVEATAIGPAPAFLSNGVVNAASFNTGPSAANVAISPGSLLTIFGTSLALGAETAKSLPLPVLLAETSIRVNGVPVPLLYVSPTQLNFQAPFTLTGPNAEIVVTSLAGSSGPILVPVGNLQPGLFFDIPSGLGAIRHDDDGVSILDRPAARPGEVLQVYATGLGAVEPPIQAGVAAPLSPLNATAAKPRVFIGEIEADVLFSGLAPTFAGLYQVNIRVPANLVSGQYAVLLEVEGLRSNEVALDIE